MSRDILSHLASLTRQLRDTLLIELTANVTTTAWRAHEERFRQQTGIADRPQFADSVAQALTCTCFGLQSFADPLLGRGIAWLIEGADPLVADILRLSCGDTSRATPTPAVLNCVRNITRFLDTGRVAAICRQLPKAPTPADAAVYFYEQFLAVYDQQVRRGKGVFYTPHALVAFVVRSIDVLLEDEFSLPSGLADTATWREICAASVQVTSSNNDWLDRPFVRVLDPAMGTGAFLLETMAAAEQRFHRSVATARTSTDEANRQWNEYVARSLLPRLWGQELMLPPLVLGQLAMTAWLAGSGFRFEQPGKLNCYLSNTLQRPDIGCATQRNQAEPFTVVLGNPPFSGVSENRETWMRELLRGRAPNSPTGVANYFLSQGKPLQERKHWLEDDYVKFMRFAHWQIETAGSGIVALVTNHGYLDNSTFRGMREQLLATFPRVNVVNLHGNSRNGERAPDGGPDESIFGIEQGVAVSLLRRLITPNSARSVKLADLWGAGSSKLQTLANHSTNSLTWKSIAPQAPYFFFTHKDHRLLKEYEAGYRLCDIMPTNSTAVVTARDGFVVAFDETELCQRMRQFADPTNSDNEIRARFFGNTRSRKYPPGDTRGWRMKEARQRLFDDPSWETYIRPCMYRPFDRRQILWASWMIDWPRSNVMNHLAEEGNLALIARRQMPPSQPCSHFWVTDTITLDGVVRSDNRGSESVFPLYLLAPSPASPNAVCGNATREPSRSKQPNFSEAFIAYCSARLGLPWTPAAPGRASASLTPRDLFHYIYALFHCPSYRLRFAEHLRIDFPRVLIPHQRELFFHMARLGEDLVHAHLLRADNHRSDSSAPPDLHIEDSISNVIKPGYPRYRDQTIWLNSSTGFSPVRKEVWEFRVGTYQVCRKWLKDRRKRVLSSDDFGHYSRVLHAIDTTLGVTHELDHQIDQYGGWQTAF